jgi:hypothetical protein
MWQLKIWARSRYGWRLLEKRVYKREDLCRERLMDLKAAHMRKHWRTITGYYGEIG